MKKATRSLLYSISVALIILTLWFLFLKYVLRIKSTYYKGNYISLEGFQASKTSPFFTDAYVINMDKYPDRFKRIEADAKNAGMVIKRWPGVEVKVEDVLSLPAKGIGTIIYTSRAGGKRNLGAIGCFLAHRGLLEHIAEKPNGVGTFICEDDVIIPPDFFSKLEKVSSEIPSDWDIIYMNKYMLDTTPISANIVKLNKDLTSSKNMGTWAFIVKNASIKDKILPALKQMIDELDLQLGRNADILNMYLTTPPIIYLHNTSSESIIEKIDKETTENK